MQKKDDFPFHERYDWSGRIFLGEGSYGKVYKVKSKFDADYYAVKQMRMDEFNHDPSLMNSLKGEISVTIDCNSDHTVNMLEFKVGNNFTYMVLELCEGDLRKELSSRKFTEPECVFVYEDLMIGFEVLVKKGYIHRDIKPANVLVKNKHYKVSDFGFACKADLFGKKKLTDICGTPIYMAPQLLASKPYTAKSDIWSLGLMLYEMIFGYPPWPARSLEEYRRAIETQPLTFPYNAKLGENTKNFLIRSLVVDEEKRMGWNELLAHPLIKQKEVGQNVKEVVISEYLRSIMVKLQAEIKKKSINIRAILQKHKKDKLNLEEFAALLREGDPTLTSYEIKALFDHLDQNKEGSLSWQDIMQSLAYIDYRDADNVVDRRLDDLVAIIQCRKENPNELFNSIDVNHSGSLDWAEFSKFITTIGPCYTKSEILDLFRLFDVDRSGLISKAEFIGFLQAKLPSGKQHVIQEERANRNIKTLVSYLKWSKITPDAVLKLADVNKDNSVQLGEFAALLKKLNFVVSEAESFEMFTLINKNKDKQINLQELMLLLK